MARARVLVEVVGLILGKARADGDCLIADNASRYARRRFNGRDWYAHCLVARYFYGLCPKGQEVRHLCGKGAEGCVKPSHLRYGTRSENIQDRKVHGGEPHGPLDEDSILEVRRLRGLGLSYVKIAKALGIARMTAWRIINGRTYAWLARV